MSRRAAFFQFLDGIQAGDPVALGLLAFVVLLAAVAGAIWVVDRRSRRREEARAVRKKPRRAG